MRTRAEGDSSNIQNIKLPFPEKIKNHSNFEDYSKLLKEKYGIVFEFNAPGDSQNANNWRALSEIKTLGQQRNLKLRVRLENTHSTKTEIDLNPENYTTKQNDGSYELSLDVQIPTRIEVQNTWLNTLEATGNTKNIDIDQTKVDEIIQKIIDEHRQRVQIEFAIGSDVQKIAIKENSSQTWFALSEFKENLKNYNDLINHDNKNVYARFRLKPEVNSDDYVISESPDSSTKIVVATLKSYLDVSKYLSNFRFSSPTFLNDKGEEVHSNNVTSITPAFTINESQAKLKSVGVEVRFLNSEKGTFSTDFPKLGQPPKLFAILAIKENQLTEFSEHGSANNVTKPVEIPLDTLRKYIDISTDELKDLIDFSGNTKNINIDEEKLKTKNSFGYERVDVLYAFGKKQTNDDANNISLDPSEPSKKWFTKDEITSLLKLFNSDIYLYRKSLDRSNAGLKPFEVVLKAKLDLKHGIALSDYVINKADEVVIEDLKSVKSYVDLKRHYEAIDNRENHDYNLITWGNSTSARQIKKVVFPISVGESNELRNKGIDLKFGLGETSDNLDLNWDNDFSNDPKDLGEPKKMKIKFEIKESHKQFIHVEDQYTQTIVKENEQLAIPNLIVVDTNNLLKIQISGDTKNIQIDDSQAINSITLDKEKVQVLYSLGDEAKNQLIKLKRNSQDEWFTKEEFIDLLKRYNLNIYKEQKIINVKYALKSGLSIRTHDVSDKSSKSPSLNNLKTHLDLNEVIERIQKEHLTFASAKNTKDLGPAELPLTLAEKEIFKEYGIVPKWSTIANPSDESAILDQQPTILGEPPFLGLKFALDSNGQTKTVLSEDSQAWIDVTPYALKETINVVSSDLTKIAATGNTKDIVIDESKALENLSQHGQKFVEIRYAINGIDFSNSLEHNNRSWLTKDELLEFLRSYKNDIVGNQKKILAHFFLKPGTDNTKFELTSKETIVEQEINVSELLSYIHLEEHINTLEKESTTFGDNDTTTNITQVFLPLEETKLQRLQDSGIKLQYATRASRSGSSWNVEENDWSDNVPTRLNTDTNGKPQLLLRFVVDSTNSQKPFIDPSFTRAIKLNAAIKINIQVIPSNLALVDIVGNTRILDISNEERALESIEVGNKSRVQIQYAIGSAPSYIKLDGQKTWYTASEFKEALAKYPHTIYAKRISARYSVIASQENEYKVSSQAPQIVEPESIASSSKVQVYVHQIQGDIVNNTLVLGTNDDVRITLPKWLQKRPAVLAEGESASDYLVQGLKLQYTNSRDHSTWYDTAPASIDERDKYLALRIVGEPGYIYASNQVHVLRTDKIKDNVKIESYVSLLSSTSLTGNTRDIQIDESRARAVLEKTRYKDDIVIKYSLGVAIDGIRWFEKDEFINLLKRLNGQVNETNAIIKREQIVARYDFKDPNEQRFVLTIEGISVSSENINSEERSKFVVNVVSPTNNTNLKGYINTQHILGQDLDKVEVSGETKRPVLKINETFLNFLNTYNGQNSPFILEYTSKTDGENPDFSSATLLVPNILPFQPVWPLNTELDSEKPSFAFRFRANSNYVLGDGTNDNTLNEFVYKFIDKKNIKVLKTLQFDLNSKPQLELIAGSSDNGVMYQGKTSVNNKSTETLDSRLTWYYHVTKTKYETREQIENIVKNNAAWTSQVPTNLKVGDYVMVKADVRDANEYVLRSTNQNYYSDQLFVTGLKLDSSDLKLDSNNVEYESISRDLRRNYDGQAIISRLALEKDVFGNHLGVDIEMYVAPKYIKNKEGNIIVDRFGSPIIEREGASSGRKIQVDTGGNFAIDAQGNDLYYIVDSNGLPGKPKTDENGKWVALENVKGDGVFNQINTSEGLFENQDVKFRFKAKNGFILDDQLTKEINHTIRGLKYLIGNSLQFQFADLKANFTSSRPNESRPVNGFSRFTQDAISARILDKPGGTFQEVVGFNNIIDALRKINPNLNLKMTINRVSSGRFTIYDDLDKALPGDLSNQDEILIEAYSKDPRFDIEIESLKLTVNGLPVEPPIASLKYLRTNFVGELNGTGTFEVLTTNTETHQEELSKDYVWEYKVNNQKWQRNILNNLKNGDKIQWRLVKSGDVLSDEFLNKIASPIGSQSFRVSTYTDDDNKVKDGFIVRGLKDEIVVGDFNAEKLVDLDLSFVGDSGSGSIKPNLSGLALPEGTEIQYIRKSTGEVIRDLSNAKLSNGEIIITRLVATEKALSENKILKAVVEREWEVKNLEKENSVIATAVSASVAAVGVVLISILGFGTYRFIRRRKMK